ncbi:MAG: DUF3060 domain-containing protein [Verrucomicrobiales bacterium]
MSDHLVITPGTVKQPVMDADGRDVVVSGNGCKVELSGQCGDLKVIGSGHQVKAHSVATLSLLGSNNILVIGTLGAAKFNGADNALTWTRASNGKKAPSFSLNGAGNSVSMAVEPKP